MSFIVLKTSNDMCGEARRSKLSEAVERAEELIEEGVGNRYIICKETDNQAAKKLDWTEPYWKRTFVCEVK